MNKDWQSKQLEDVFDGRIDHRIPPGPLKMIDEQLPEAPRPFLGGQR